MQKKKQQSSLGGTSKGAYIFLITAIVVLLVILLYLVGIMFCPPFTRFAMRTPGLSGITNAMVGNLYQDDTSFSDKGKDKKDGTKITATDTTTEEGKDKVNQTLLEYDISRDASYLNHCIFLGDSRTVAMVTYGYLPEDSTLAEVGLCHVNAEEKIYTFSSGLQYSFSTYLETHQADVIYISYGINGVGYTDEETYKNKYEQLIDNVMQSAPDSILVLQSIWPVREGYAMTQKITNERVDYYNDFLYNLAQEKGIYYLDTASVLKDDYNSMKGEYNSGDGLHYNEAGYEAVFSYILSHPVPDIE